MVSFNCGFYRILPQIILLTCFSSAIVASTSAQGALLETRKLVPPFNNGQTVFGRSVDIDDGRIIVGTNGDDIVGSSSGSAYLFDANSGTQLHKLFPRDASSSDWFGWSVSISNSFAVIGARQDDDKGRDSGSAYIFDVATGKELRKLTGLDSSSEDNFGYSVATNGDAILVGSPFWGNGSGKAYLFDAQTGNQLREFTASDDTSDQHFGISVAIDGNIAVIGANRSDQGGADAGSVYIFDTDTGQLENKLLAEDATPDDYFGTAVDVQGATVLVGAPGLGRSSSPGAAYLFSAMTGTQIQKLSASDGLERDVFGSSVAIDEGIAVVGSYSHDAIARNAGAIYAFDSESGSEIAKMLASDGVEDDWLGWSTAIDGGLIVAGAVNHVLPGQGHGPGAAYVFTVPEMGSAGLLLTMGIGLTLFDKSFRGMLRV